MALAGFTEEQPLRAFYFHGPARRFSLCSRALAFLRRELASSRRKKACFEYSDALGGVSLYGAKAIRNARMIAGLHLFDGTVSMAEL